MSHVLTATLWVVPAVIVISLVSGWQANEEPDTRVPAHRMVGASESGVVFLAREYYDL